MILNFFKSVGTWLFSRRKLAPRAVIEFRHQVCEACIMRQKSKTRFWGWRWFCALCGCTLSRRRWVFNKLAMPHEECPVKRWLKINE